MLTASVASNLEQVRRRLDAFARQQVPFAAAQALNAVATLAQEAEKANLHKVLDRPTPFTVNSVKVRRANKANLTAVLYLMDKAAEYLAPYEFGGRNKLYAKALLKPVEAKLNQYGNMQRRQIAKYASRPDVFIGVVKTRNGDVNGVWQRIKPTRGKPGGLKLLVKFEDAHEARQHLGWRTLAKATLDKHWDREFGRALARAIASSR